MTTILFTHAACLGHDTGPGHPERVARLEAVLAELSKPAFAALERRDAPEATVADLCLAHPRRYVDSLLESIPAEGIAMLDADTAVSPGSRGAALRAAGAGIAAVDAVCTGQADNAFCAVRPPGHHAEPGHAMGFCLFNNVVIAARHARRAHGLQRIAIVDFDVHHGNGSETQALADPDLFYASTHQNPLYPGSGTMDFDDKPNVVNVPLPPHSGPAAFRAAMTDKVLPALRGFAPELVIVSAGFDAHRDDPLAELNLTEDDYAWVTGELLAVARDCAGGRLVSMLEGGYDLGALARSAGAHVRALMAA